MGELICDKAFTHFASPGRLPLNRVIEQSHVVAKLKDAHNIFNTFPDVIMVLNEHRQMVYCNNALLELLNISSDSQLLGARPGEILHCIHAHETEAGCGTSEHCSACGAALAIITSQTGETNSQECRLTVKQGQEFVSLDLLFTANSCMFEGESFTIVLVSDISSEKRRKALERIFFHDIINTAGSLRGIVELINYTREPAKVQELLTDLEQIADSLIEEILEQRDLVNAENNELRVNKDTIQSADLLNNIMGRFLHQPGAEGISLKLAVDTENVSFVSDPILLTRVLGNMIKNALEAARPGDTVVIGCRSKERQVQFWVNNPQVMAREVQLQIFQRSFSTKGSGRGLGTYSMKLLTERYLKGTISFMVEEGTGTTFIASYPLNF